MRSMTCIFILCCLAGLVREYVQTNEILKDVSASVRVVKEDEHAAVADRGDVDFAFDDFVNEVIGFDDQLVKSLGIRRDGVVALDGNGLMREGEVAESAGTHTAALACFMAKSFSWSRTNTTSLGMPLPSANSRREISMSDSSSAISSRREIVMLAMVNVPHFACGCRIVYDKHAENAMWFSGKRRAA